jgi:hypothetical protein
MKILIISLPRTGSSNLLFSLANEKNLKPVIEPFNSNKQTFVLLGDSILKNDAYVSDGKSVDYLLSERTNGKTIALALDHSKIVDVFDQISDIPDTANNKLTTVFLSAGAPMLADVSGEGGCDVQFVRTHDLPADAVNTEAQITI